MMHWSLSLGAWWVSMRWSSLNSHITISYNTLNDDSPLWVLAYLILDVEVMQLHELKYLKGEFQVLVALVIKDLCELPIQRLSDDLLEELSVLVRDILGFVPYGLELFLHLYDLVHDGSGEFLPVEAILLYISDETIIYVYIYVKYASIFSLSY